MNYQITIASDLLIIIRVTICKQMMYKAICLCGYNNRISPLVVALKVN